MPDHPLSKESAEAMGQFQLHRLSKVNTLNPLLVEKKAGKSLVLEYDITGTPSVSCS